MDCSPARPLRVLTAAALTAVLLPAVPALAQTAPPTSAPTTSPAPPAPAPARPEVAVSAQTIDVGGTVELSVRGTPGSVVDVVASAARFAPRVIRTTTLDAAGTARWTLQPGETTTFVVRPRDAAAAASDPVVVRVRRTVTIGVRRDGAVYVFSGAIARAVPGVQVTIARLDGQTGRVTGVASTRTDAAGRYEIATSLPAGLDGYYALTEATPDLLAGRSRLYGLLVNVRPGTTTQAVTLDVRRLGEYHVFSGAVTPRRAGVPVTLARVVDGRLVGVVGGLTGSTGEYSLSLPLSAGTTFFQALTATARSRVYGLVVPAVVASAAGAATGVPADRDCADFATQREAQAFYDRYVDRLGDVARLDGDDDGTACDALP